MHTSDRLDQFLSTTLGTEARAKVVGHFLFLQEETVEMLPRSDVALSQLGHTYWLPFWL